jgi:hypothetical protein
MVAPRRFSPWPPLACLCAAAAILPISGCGGSSATHPASTKAGSGAVGRDIISNGPVIQRPLRGTGGGEINDDNPSRADSGKATTTTERAR